MKTPPRELSVDQSASPDEPSRREFLRLAGGTLGLAGASGCTRAPRGHIVPYASQPPEVTPGVASHYATALSREGYGVGVVVESHEGRPTKIEGNPDHPTSRGGSGVFEQATLLGLYDRDRGARISKRGAAASRSELASILSFPPADRGAGLHVLLEPQTSPLTENLLGRLVDRFPDAALHFHAALSPRNAWEGARIAFGAVAETQVDFRKADVVLALDSDFLTTGPASLPSARDFASRRRPEPGHDAMNRLYVVEPGPTVTGSTADHRLRLRRVAVADFVRALLSELGEAIGGPAAASVRDRTHVPAERRSWDGRWLGALARDLLAHRGQSAVVVGEAQPAAVHALVHAVNDLLGNIGSTVHFCPSPVAEAGAASHSLAVLGDALRGGAVKTLLVLGGNPVYASPRDLGLGDAFRRVQRSVYLGEYENETAAACALYVPQAHVLASWGAVRAVCGTGSIVQPLCAPPDAARTVDEILAAFADDFRSDTSAHDLSRAFWQGGRGADFDRFWRESLRTGLIEGSASPRGPRALQWGRVADALSSLPPPPDPGDIELVLREDARVRDGAATNNGWLLELPDPVTKLTWENAALLSKATAARLGVATGDVLFLRAGAGVAQAPALVVQGHADDAVTLPFGYGRSGGETLASGLGANAYLLQTLDARWGGPGLDVQKSSKKVPLALAQGHFSIEGRDDEVFRRATLERFRREPHFARTKNDTKRSLYVFPQESGRQWGMVIDLSVCTGCSACVVACQAENNIPIVGPAGVMKGREMHWIRIDRYFDGDDDEARPLSEPMLCQHCERAPCEYVCPVGATSHSADGLNQMVYNRCVGTRFCSNNCPWKVRRFNWFDYALDPDAADPLAHNPDVTVRGRGVIEKCTYCVQRIREAEIGAEVAGRPVGDHDVKTACEQACPSAAIVFGDIADPASDVSRARESPRLFAVLGELGTVPHTRYLAKIENVNEELA